MPKSQNEILKWFRLYTSYVLQWAVIAQREGVDVLGLGAEMRALAQTKKCDPAAAVRQQRWQRPMMTDDLPRASQAPSAWR